MRKLKNEENKYTHKKEKERKGRKEGRNEQITKSS